MRDRGCLGATVQDPYIKWSHRDNTGTDPKEWNAGGSTKHRVNDPNPDFFDTPFTFNWMQGVGQVWRFEVMDFDIMNKDDAIATLELKVDDFINKRGGFFAKFEKVSQGSLFIKEVNLLKFKLAAKDIIKLDAFNGLSDPYVECFWSAGKGGPETQFAKTKTIKNVENCEWEDVIEFPIYQAGTDQYWIFKMFDKDPLPKDDPIGEAVILVDEFVKSKGIFLCKLSDKEGNDSKLIVTPIVV